MKVVVGLGNIGDTYKYNRHNVGFLIVDRLVSSLDLTFSLNKNLRCYIAKNSEYIFIKPTTYMNSSGEAVSAVLNYFNLTPSDLYVIQDDVDLSFSTLRIKNGGGSAGHHGIESISQCLKTVNFNRVRFGVGRSEDPNIDVSVWVLSDFTDSELSYLENFDLSTLKIL